MGREAENYAPALQALGYLSDNETTAEGECNRILGLIENAHSDGVSDENGEVATTPIELDEFGIRQFLARAEITEEDTHNAKAALAVFQIDRLIEQAGELAEVESGAPRVKDVGKRLETVSREAHKLASALEDGYVVQELVLASALKTNSPYISPEEPSAGNLVKELRQLSNLASKALKRRELHLSDEGDVEYSSPVLEDSGGKRKATSLSRLPAKQHFVGLCLGVFNQHKQGATGNVEGSFARFAQWIWLLGTDEESDLERPIRDVFSLIKTGEGASIDKILALHLTIDDLT